MIKRISCRIIESVSFKKTSSELLCARQSNKHRCKTGNADTTAARLKAVVNTVRNTGIHSIVSGTSDFPIGQIVDYHA